MYKEACSFTSLSKRVSRDQSVSCLVLAVPWVCILRASHLANIVSPVARVNIDPLVNAVIAAHRRRERTFHDPSRPPHFPKRCVIHPTFHVAYSKDSISRGTRGVSTIICRPQQWIYQHKCILQPDTNQLFSETACFVLLHKFVSGRNSTLSTRTNAMAGHHQWCFLC